ncbi:MAG: molybdenum cofactor guanylyltransferase [Phycisphaerae bacterium]|nr:molybdenum cofactor guanylyltransferase [Phycisphaerae bacterium]
MEIPILGGVLVGGASTRMGRPKHALELDGKSFLRRVVDALTPHVAHVVLLGDAPGASADVGRAALRDADGVRGPLAGILAAMRSEPAAAWLIASCDLPLVTSDAIAWLLSQRDSSSAAIMPRTADGRIEPLLALYEPASREVFESMAALGEFGVQRVAERVRVRICPIPPALLHCWRNVNTPDDLAGLCGA